MCSNIPRSATWVTPCCFFPFDHHLVTSTCLNPVVHRCATCVYENGEHCSHAPSNWLLCVEACQVSKISSQPVATPAPSTFSFSVYALWLDRPMRLHVFFHCARR
ncbi:hypothetical protein MIND_00424300 [Mycena indigotica]|uniref:Uncharacterized protein n=1 Tax=Mycena indigotica TaxID=2126181 RepID=A0A8H6W7Z4_9AGAR|nr:uncharacterized protein MIND_00424300 [Mycena indigotica]KAF7306331.1 hypothetical protein MIND_00424300 [Mycena indigotica]